MSIERTVPKRGEIWRVNFDPTVGAEIQKVRPAVVVSSDSLGKLPIKLIAPVTVWSNAFAGNLWHVQIALDPDNGRTHRSARRSLIRALYNRGYTKKCGKRSGG